MKPKPGAIVRYENEPWIFIVIASRKLPPTDKLHFVYENVYAVDENYVGWGDWDQDVFEKSEIL